MQTVELESHPEGMTVQDQLVALGYKIRTKGLPKYMAEKGGKYYWVLITPLFQGCKLRPDQVVTANFLEDYKVEVLMVKMPK